MKHCSVDACKSKYYGKGLCQIHWQRSYRFGRLENVRQRHGAKHSTEYNIWVGIKARCFNPNHHAYKHYGGRDITMHPEWVNDFARFLKDMGGRPSNKHSIDRIDVNGNYEPLNCRWATHHEQGANRRCNKKTVGVYYDKARKRWKASLEYETKVVLQKRFLTYKEAVAARKAAETKYL